MVQFAFLVHISHEDIAHKKEPEEYSLFVKWVEKYGLFDLVYVYTNEGEARNHTYRSF